MHGRKVRFPPRGLGFPVCHTGFLRQKGSEKDVVWDGAKTSSEGAREGIHMSFCPLLCSLQWA